MAGKLLNLETGGRGGTNREFARYLMPLDLAGDGRFVAIDVRSG
jgi:hypothetical protein